MSDSHPPHERHDSDHPEGHHDSDHPCEEEHECRETYCDRDRKNNVWLEGANPDGSGGVCLLDTMTESQVINSIQRDPTARADLLRVTSSRHLRHLAETLPDLPKVEEGDQLQKEINAQADSIPFYSIFRGQPPFAQ
jgi:hypothetical protein